MPSADRNATIEVLLATFQGETWLPAQIASILAQTYADLRILARDDGSTDSTAELLAQAAAACPERVRVLETDLRTGSAAGNFARLLRASTAPYVAFADQDDVWSSHKLQLTMERMHALERSHGEDVPLLVFTDLQVVDEDLRLLAPSLWKNNRVAPRTVRHPARLLSENVATGCTALINRPMVELAQRMPLGASTKNSSDLGVFMHDHWIALLASTLGHAAWINEPTVAYRQHRNNVVGAAHTDRSIAGKLRRLLGNEAAANRAVTRRALQRQAEAFLRCYREELSDEDCGTLMAYSTLDQQTRLVRMARIVRYGFWRPTASRNIATMLDLLR